MEEKSAQLRWLVLARCPYCREWIELPGIFLHCDLAHSHEPEPTIRKISWQD
jgi:hypothetical protein